MTSEIAPLIIVMIKLFFALAIGFSFQRKHIFNPDSNRKLSELIVTITAPCMILASAAEKSNTDKGEMVQLLIAGFLIYIFMCVIAFLCAKVFKIAKPNDRTFQALLIFGNSSFMGYPVVQALYGNSAILLTSVVHLPFNLFVFTYGVYLLAGEKHEDSLSIAQRLKQAINPGLIAAVCALIVFLFSIQLPTVVTSCISFIGDMTPALSMITLGSILGEFEIGNAFKTKDVWIISIFRLLIIPIIIYLCCRPFFSGAEVLGVLLLSNAMPCASMNAMLSSKYKGQEQYAASGIFVCTVVSMVTIPLLTFLFL